MIQGFIRIHSLITSLCHSSQFYWIGGICVVLWWASLVAQMVSNTLAMQEPWHSIPESGRSLGEGKGYPLRYSCLENPMDRGAWWATVHMVIWCCFIKTPQELDKPQYIHHPIIPNSSFL